eukprot:350556-Chlamydomonas_euryale.AAC.4
MVLVPQWRQKVRGGTAAAVGSTRTEPSERQANAFKAAVQAFEAAGAGLLSGSAGSLSNRCGVEMRLPMHGCGMHGGASADG